MFSCSTPGRSATTNTSSMSSHTSTRTPPLVAGMLMPPMPPARAPGIIPRAMLIIPSIIEPTCRLTNFLIPIVNSPGPRG